LASARNVLETHCYSARPQMQSFGCWLAWSARKTKLRFSSLAYKLFLALMPKRPL